MTDFLTQKNKGIIWSLLSDQQMFDGINPQYKLEDTSILVNILKALCFVILIFGTMLYHDMLPWFGSKARESLLLTDSDEGSMARQR